MDVGGRRRKRDSRGGARAGAGRKPEFRRRIQATFQLEERELQDLTALADAEGVSLSRYLRTLVRRYLRRRLT